MIQTFKYTAASIALSGVIALGCAGIAATVALVNSATHATSAYADSCSQWEEWHGTWRYGSKGWWYQLNSYQFAIDRWNIDGKTYYFDNNGWMQTGWQKIYDQWYYFNKSGAAATGWQKINGIWYYFSDNGIMATGWNKVNGTWYYHNKSGAMQTGWQKVGGKWYYLNQSGVMATNTQIDKYYLTSDGSMATNRWIDNRFFQKDGSLATSQWVGNYHVNEKGMWDASRNALFGNKYYDSNSKEVVFTGKHIGALLSSKGNLEGHIPTDSTVTLDIKSYDPSSNSYTADITVFMHLCYGMIFAPCTDEELLACDRIYTFPDIQIDQGILLHGGTLWNGLVTYEEETEEGSRTSYVHNFTIASSNFNPANCTVDINFIYDLFCSEHVDTYTVKLI